MSCCSLFVLLLILGLLCEVGNLEEESIPYIVTEHVSTLPTRPLQLCSKKI
jgi:hypothetical protein